MKNPVWQTDLTWTNRRAQLAAAGIVGAFVVLFAASILISFYVNRDPVEAAAAAMDRWKIQVVTLLGRNQRFPEGQHCANGTVQLGFRLDRTGKLVDSRIQSSSGIAAFDSEALDMVARVGRFPPPPSSAPDVMSLTVPINFEAAMDDCPPRRP